jgi:hypothetical protein
MYDWISHIKTIYINTNGDFFALKNNITCSFGECCAKKVQQVMLFFNAKKSPLVLINLNQSHEFEYLPIGTRNLESLES